MNYHCDTCNGTGQLQPEDVGDVYHLGGICGDCNATGEIDDDTPSQHADTARIPAMTQRQCTLGNLAMLNTAAGEAQRLTDAEWKGLDDLVEIVRQRLRELKHGAAHSGVQQ
jgi:hypothetical protein